MTEAYTWARSDNPAEARFASFARVAGLEVLVPPPIYCPEPVKDSHCNKKKLSTNVDFLVVDYINVGYVFVEVTEGGRTGHKKAQGRVVKAAKIQNYVVVTHEDLDVLRSLRSPLEKLDYFHYLFGWIGSV